MAAKKTIEKPVIATEADAAAQSPAMASADPPDAAINRQMSELKELVLSLSAAVQESQTRNAQNAEFRSTLSEIKQVARAIPAATAIAPVPHDGCGCDCCTASDCCCFEIVLDKVRAIQPQLEPADMGDAGPTINELEVRLFASIENVGVLIPGLSTTMGLRVPSFLAGGGPGHWVSLNNAVINRVYLKKGTTKAVTVDFQAAEVDEGIERPAGWKDEHGTASGSITLDCCTSKIYPPMPTDLSFDFGGTGGGIPGAISVAFYARRVCC